MPRDAVSRTANVGTVGKNGLRCATRLVVTFRLRDDDPRLYRSLEMKRALLLVNSKHIWKSFLFTKTQ